MSTMIMRENNGPDYSLDHMMEAFTDILEATGSKVFDNIELDIRDGEQFKLDYDVTLTGTHITKLFDMEQGLPEIKTDIMAFLFSMLDGAVNL